MTEKELHDRIAELFTKIDLMLIAGVYSERPGVSKLENKATELWRQWVQLHRPFRIEAYESEALRALKLSANYYLKLQTLRRENSNDQTRMA